MKTFLLIPILLILCVSAVRAQTLAPALNSVWFIDVGAGLAALDNGAFNRRLASYIPPAANGEDRLYQNGQFSGTGYTLNAGAGFLFSERYIIGASGEKLSHASILSITPPGTPRDEYRLSGIGGGLDIGYAVVNEDATLVYPYLQAGYYGYSLEYDNAQTDSIPFFEGTPVAPGTTATFKGAAPRISLGIGLVTFLGGGDSDGSAGGFLVSARLSWGTMLARPEWEQDGIKVNNGGLTPAYNGVSLSLSIGGGGGR